MLRSFRESVLLCKFDLNNIAFTPSAQVWRDRHWESVAYQSCSQVHNGLIGLNEGIESRTRPAQPNENVECKRMWLDVMFV